MDEWIIYGSEEPAIDVGVPTTKVKKNSIYKCIYEPIFSYFRSHIGTILCFISGWNQFLDDSLKQRDISRNINKYNLLLKKYIFASYIPKSIICYIFI